MTPTWVFDYSDILDSDEYLHLIDGTFWDDPRVIHFLVYFWMIDSSTILLDSYDPRVKCYLMNFWMIDRSKINLLGWLSFWDHPWVFGYFVIFWMTDRSKIILLKWLIFLRLFKGI